MDYEKAGYRLLTNHSLVSQAAVWGEAKAATNAAVFIGMPGGLCSSLSGAGLWVRPDFDGDLSSFWREVDRIDAAKKRGART